MPADLATHGRSDRWRGNVLTDTAVATLPLGMPAGAHRVAIAARDPGILLDRIKVVLDRARGRYGADR